MLYLIFSLNDTDNQPAAVAHDASIIFYIFIFVWKREAVALKSSHELPETSITARRTSNRYLAGVGVAGLSGE